MCIYFQQLSQFWYDDATIKGLCHEVCRITTEGNKIALISCPSLYKTMKQIAKNREGMLFHLRDYDEVTMFLKKEFESLIYAGRFGLGNKS